MRRALSVAAWLLASATAADVPPKPQQACAADADCVLTHFAGCCARECCPTGPRAMSKADLDRQQQRCAIIDCAMRGCPDVKCAAPKPDASFKAVCRQGACVAEPRQAAAAECTANSDCVIEYPTPVCRPGPCGCCPGTEPVAVPASRQEDRAPPRAEPREPPQPPKQDPKFGLSQGGPAPVNCAPCPGPRPATAACSAGKCVVAPVLRPRPPG